MAKIYENSKVESASTGRTGVAMNVASATSRFLLGFMFTVFGLNGFLHFIPMPPLSGMPAQFMGVMAGSRYMVPVYSLQLVGGIFLLLNRYVPLALTLLGPVLVNILIYHFTMDPAGIAPGIVATVCWASVFYSVRSAFAGIFQAKVE